MPGYRLNCPASLQQPDDHDSQPDDKQDVDKSSGGV